MKYHLYTDGSSHAKGNLPIGWGWLVVDPIAEMVYGHDSGSEAEGTNNTAELTAAIEGLAWCLGNLPEDAQVHLRADSQYVLGCVGGGYQPTKNLELVARIQGLAKAFGNRLTGEWVKGHSGEVWNDAVDHLATTAKKLLVEVLVNSGKMPAKVKRSRKDGK